MPVGSIDVLFEEPVEVWLWEYWFRDWSLGCDRLPVNPDDDEVGELVDSETLVLIEDMFKEGDASPVDVIEVTEEEIEELLKGSVGKPEETEPVAVVPRVEMNDEESEGVDEVLVLDWVEIEVVNVWVMVSVVVLSEV